ncbi:MAG: hypothetical protein QXV21_03395 [Candidatus Bathyarchaeia archaeon]
MAKKENNVRKGGLGIELQCQYCGQWWILRLSPNGCPHCGYPTAGA